MPTTLRDYLASLPAAGGTLDTDDTVAALEDGTLVAATPAQLGAGGGGAPSGPAGGVLSGTYPNPGFAADMATQAELDAVAAAKQPLDADLTALAAAGNSAVLAATTASFLTADETKLDGIETGADVTDATNVDAAGAVMNTDYDANTILAAAADNTPAPLTVAFSRIVGRKASGSIAALTGTEVAAILPSASTTVASVVELATNTEAITGTDVDRALTPAAGTAAFSPRYLTVNAQTGTTYTLVLADDGDLVTLSNAGAITLTVPTNASVAFPVGTQVHLAQLGAGQVTIAGAGGVTVNGTPGLKHRAQYSAATLIKVATDTWLAVGDLAA